MSVTVSFMPIGKIMPPNKGSSALQSGDKSLRTRSQHDNFKMRMRKLGHATTHIIVHVHDFNRMALLIVVFVLFALILCYWEFISTDCVLVNTF